MWASNALRKGEWVEKQRLSTFVGTNTAILEKYAKSLRLYNDRATHRPWKTGIDRTNKLKPGRQEGPRQDQRERTISGRIVPGVVEHRPVDDVVVPRGVAEAKVEELSPVQVRIGGLFAINHGSFTRARTGGLGLGSVPRQRLE